MTFDHCWALLNQENRRSDCLWQLCLQWALSSANLVFGGPCLLRALSILASLLFNELCLWKLYLRQALSVFNRHAYFSELCLWQPRLSTTALSILARALSFRHELCLLYFVELFLFRKLTFYHRVLEPTFQHRLRQAHHHLALLTQKRRHFKLHRDHFI